MRIYITVTEEPLYINAFIKKIIQAIPSEIIGVAIVKGSLLSLKKGKSKIEYLLTIILISSPIQLIKEVYSVLAFRLFEKLKMFGIQNCLSLAKIAGHYKIPVIYVDNLHSSEFIGYLKQQSPDVIINQAQVILKKDFISIPTIGCLNRHGALLPKYRGRLAPFWAYVNGEKETGVSIHFVDEQLDNGDILIQRRIPIKRFDSLYTLLNRIFFVAPSAMLDALDKIRSNEFQSSLIKNDHIYATYYSSPRLIDALKYRQVMLRRFIFGK
jgi:folate-dependent phosphoribosylglycinamide formyltransferase PurN